MRFYIWNFSYKLYLIGTAQLLSYIIFKVLDLVEVAEL